MGWSACVISASWGETAGVEAPGSTGGANPRCLRWLAAGYHAGRSSCQRAAAISPRRYAMPPGELFCRLGADVALGVGRRTEQAGTGLPGGQTAGDRAQIHIEEAE